jgi:hypothetical protein
MLCAMAAMGTHTAAVSRAASGRTLQLVLM